MKERLDEYKLLLPENPDASLLFAASELDGIMRLCGLHAPTRVFGRKQSDDKVISLGETEYKLGQRLVADPNYGGGYNITTLNGDVFIYAKEPSGIINGVYRFMQIIAGYEFYAEDEIYVDKLERYFVTDINLSEKPDFAGRRLDSFVLYHNAEYALRLRQNESCMDDDPRLGEGTPWAELHDQSLAFQLVPYEQYKTQEYIDKGWWSEKGNQLCWTKALYDDEFFAFLSDRLIDAVKREPTKMFYMLGQTDNPFYCECETCRRDYEKYGVSGVFMRLVNKLADAVKQYIDKEQGGREHYLCMFAYLQTMKPPVKVDNGKIVPVDESVVARDNVMIRIAPIESGVLCSHLDARANPFSAAGFIGWRAVAKKFAIWDYGTDFSAYTVPYPDWDVLGKNLRFYREYGAVDLLTQVPAHTGGTEFFAMKLYVRAKLMWDASQDEQELMRNFIRRYYGSAAPAITEYLGFLKEHYAKLKREAMYTATIYAPLMNVAYWKYSDIQTMESIFAKAFELVKNGESGARKELIESRLRTESLFYRLIKFDSYKLKFTADEQEKQIDEFERDAKAAGFIAFSNGWKQGRGKLETLISDHRRRIDAMRLAEQLSKADNPLSNCKYLEEFETDDKF